MNDVQRAHMLVTRAIRDGFLVREACEFRGCGRDKTDAHHEDYTKPLEVIWLCRMHHRWRHCDYGSMQEMQDAFDSWAADRAAKVLAVQEQAA